MSAPGEADGPVTVLVARRVLPGKEVEFESWASELTRAASAFDGFLGAGLLRPGHVGELWHVVYRFASADDLARATDDRARDLVRSARPHCARTSAVEDVRGHLDRDIRASADAEPGSAP